jgi:hypothetical protein
MDKRFCSRSEGFLSRRTLTALGSAVILAAAYGCSSEGTTTPHGGTGGSSNTGSGGNTSGSGGDTSGSGGDTSGSGGNTSGSGGDTSGSGGDNTGSGGSENGGSGGSETGGAAGTGGDVGPTGGAAGAAPTCPAGEGKCHEFIANDNSRNVVNYVNEFDPSKNWTSKKLNGGGSANTPRTIELINNGQTILVSSNLGYAELNLSDGTITKQQGGSSGVTGACRLPDGSTALGINNSIKFINAAGQEIKTMPSGPAGSDLRAINRQPETGNFWLSKHEYIYEVNGMTGTAEWTYNMGSTAKGYAVWWREGGGAYATTGDPSTVIEVDGTGKVLNTVGDKKKFNVLDFFSGFVRRPNGNFIVANWLGHITPKPDQPHVVEFTPDNKLIWQWGNQTLARQITNVYVFQ